eukprot:8699995-Alexandrium_andersonii.AAC.1
MLRAAGRTSQRTPSPPLVPVHCLMAALAVPAAFVLSLHGADRVGFSGPTHRRCPPSGIVLRLGFSPMWQGR